MTRTYLTSLRQERGNIGKQQKNVKKKKAFFSFVFAVLRGERCENRKKKNAFTVRGVIGYQIVRGKERKMKSQGEGRGGEGRVWIISHKDSLG